MTEFDELVRAAMRRHEWPDPPTLSAGVAPQVVRRRRPNTVSLLVAASVVVVLAVSVVVAVLGRGARHDAAPAPAPTPVPVSSASPSAASPSRTSSSAVSCPTAYPQSADALWVPDKPTVSAASHQLVPDAVPSEAVVCAYLPRAGEPANRIALSGSRTVVNPGAIPSALGLLPVPYDHMCAAYLSSADAERYLLHLTYGRDTVWVAAPGNHCAGSGNGTFRSATNLWAWVTTAYANGTAPAAVDGDQAKQCQGPGRLGQQSQLVPGTPARALVCTNGSAAHPIDRADATMLADRMAHLATSTATAGVPACSVEYDVLFEYASGPPVRVSVFPCALVVASPALSAEDPDGSVATLVAHLAGG